MSDAYKTINKTTTAEFKDRGSKFIGYLFPMEEESTFNGMMQELKSQNIKAGHFCWAYRLRDGMNRSSDDGEPSGSAGKPILNQLLSNELVDSGCIVIRYWGGTKLGVSGLINAYKTAAKDAIGEASIVTKYETGLLRIEFDYSIMGKIMDAVKALDLNIKQKLLDASPALIVEVNHSELELTVLKIKAKMLGRSIEDVQEDTAVVGLTIINDN